METQIVHKINWLVVANLGIGILAFLSGLIPLIVLLVLLSDSEITSSSPIIELYDGYIVWISHGSYLFEFTGILLGLVALVAGLTTLIFMKAKVGKRMGLVSAVLGAIGVIGNLYMFLPRG